MSDKSKQRDDEMLPEYDLGGGVRGKYAEQFSAGSNVVILDPDVAKRFKDSAAVNEALRKFAKQQAS
jgi:hypothetical protein